MVRKFKKEKVTGYTLLAVGVSLILISVYLMFGAFLGSFSPPVLVHFSDITFPISGEGNETTTISGEEMSEMIAMGFWYMLNFFVMWSGGRIASLGVGLIKEIKVEVKGLKEVKTK